jgi:hypothetical protein
MPEPVSGLVVRVGERLYFVPSSLARKVVYRTAVSRVPGTPIGMALLGGQVVSVIELDRPRAELLLCEPGGEPVALAGVEAVAAGWFEGDAGSVQFEGQTVPELDVVGELRRVEQQLWLRHGQEGEDA